MRRRTKGGSRSQDNLELLLEKAPWHWVVMEWMTSELQRKSLVQFMSTGFCGLQETRFKVFRQMEVSWRCVNIHGCGRRVVGLVLKSPKQQTVFILKATHVEGWEEYIYLVFHWVILYFGIHTTRMVSLLGLPTWESPLIMDTISHLKEMEAAAWWCVLSEGDLLSTYQIVAMNFPQCLLHYGDT